VNPFSVVSCSILIHFLHVSINCPHLYGDSRVDQCSKWVGICRYTIPELLFVPEFLPALTKYIGYYNLTIYLFQFFNSISFFAYKKYTGTSTVPFRALVSMRKDECGPKSGRVSLVWGILQKSRHQFSASVAWCSVLDPKVAVSNPAKAMYF
jgi:hypothetical protein